MFIPTNSDGQNFVNRERDEERKIKKIILTSHATLCPFHCCMILSFFFFFKFEVGPTCPLFAILGPFQSRNNLFCPDFNFIYLK